MTDARHPQRYSFQHPPSFDLVAVYLFFPQLFSTCREKRTNNDAEEEEEEEDPWGDLFQGKKKKKCATDSGALAHSRKTWRNRAGSG